MEAMAKASTKQPYSMRLDIDLVADLEREAELQNRSVANLIDTILMQYFFDKTWSRTYKRVNKQKGGKK